MAKTRTTSAKGSEPARKQTGENGAAIRAKSAGSQAETTLVPGAVNGLNGDCGNGKMRCKSLVIDGTKYRTRLNSKFENRKAYEYPDSRKITSSIPGTVIRISVQEGQEVKTGDLMLVLEAMKMKNRIMFHREGTVKSIHVSEGEKIPKDHLMLELK